MVQRYDPVPRVMSGRQIDDLYDQIDQIRKYQILRCSPIRHETDDFADMKRIEEEFGAIELGYPKLKTYATLDEQFARESMWFEVAKVLQFNKKNLKEFTAKIHKAREVLDKIQILTKQQALQEKAT